jgi:hypothetical protein
VIEEQRMMTMLATRLRKMAVLTLVMALAACAAQPPAAPSFPPITFQGPMPLALAVGSVEVVQGYRPTFAPPNVEHLFAVAPAAMAARWPQDRIRPVGGPYRLRYTVRRASVIEINLPRTGGIQGNFTKDQAQRYDAALDVTVEIVNERGLREGVVEATVARSQTVPEDITLTDRQKVWYDMVLAISRDLDTQLERNIRASLPRFLAQ